MKLSHELRFGIAFVPDVPWDEFVRRFQYIEELNFDVAALGDHFAHFWFPSKPWFEAWTLLSALATQTKQIRIGTLVTPIAWRNPAFLAKQAIMVDHISHGRLELGLGAGVGWDPGYEMTGIPNWGPRERVARFREYVEIVDQLLRNDVTTFEGQYYKVKEAMMSSSTRSETQTSHNDSSTWTKDDQACGSLCRYLDYLGECREFGGDPL